MSKKITVGNQQFSKVAIRLDKFGHDTNGNLIARHTVFAYAQDEQPATEASATLYTGKRRRQVGSTGFKDDGAEFALSKAGVEGVTRVNHEGDRTETWLTYSAA